MNPIFEHPVFDWARERVKCVIKQLEKPQETFENSLYSCFKCGKNNIFSIAKQVRSADEGTSVFNECRDDHLMYDSVHLIHENVHFVYINMHVLTSLKNP